MYFLNPDAISRQHIANDLIQNWEAKSALLAYVEALRHFAVMLEHKLLDSWPDEDILDETTDELEDDE